MSRHAHLATALTARDAAAVERALKLRILSPQALWTAVEGGLTAKELISLHRAALRGARRELGLSRLIDVLPHLPPVRQWQTPGTRALAAVLSGSEAASRYINARPKMALPICCGPYALRRKPLTVMRDELRWRRAAAAADDGFAVAVRRYRTREWVRIIARQLGGLAGCAVVLGELSDLADAVTGAFTRHLLRRERSARGPFAEGGGFAVLAQGKLGGQELNVSSDIDVQFLFSHQGEATTPLHERYTAVAQRLVQGLTLHDDHGFCYRVDVDLRPEGKKGALINSVAGAEHYYEVWGQSWERLALIRARHVAGAGWVSRSFLDAVRPFVFPRSLDMSAVEEIRNLKERVHEERKSHSLRHGRTVGVDIKRDTGCIREVEMFVQIMQLLYGGRMPGLRTTSLLRAMERLQFAGLLTQQNHDTLKAHYLFFRDIENALQAVDERQTHRLPDNPEDLEHVARLLHLGNAERLLRRLAAARRQVGQITRPLFGTGQRHRRPHRAMVVLAAQDPEARQQALQTLGFNREAGGALTVLAGSVGSPFSPYAPEKLRRLAAPLLADMARSPDPDQALRLYSDLDRQLKRHPGYLRLLAEAPTLRRRLIDLLGTSEFLGRAIIHFPELIDWLAAARDPGQLQERTADTMHKEVLQRLGKLDDIEMQLRSLRRFKLQEQLRIGILDLSGSMSIEAVQAQLSMVAEVCLRASWDLARLDLAASIGSPAEVGFTVLAMGRLGGREMGYGSDLDLLFIYDESLPDARAAVRLAQRLIQNLTLRFSEGALYAIDTRLRPSGAQGPLVSSAAGFVQYHRARAMLWERQALLRARVVAGDWQLGQRVLAELHEVRYAPALDDSARLEIHRLRSRMERELAKENPDRLNIKTGRGALVDLEFMVQYLQLRHAHAHPELQATSTPAVMGALHGARLLSARKQRLLLASYRFLRLLEMRLRIVQDRPIAAVDFSDNAADALARRMGYAGAHPGQPLRRDYERTTRLVRRLYNQIFAPGE